MTGMLAMIATLGIALSGGLPHTNETYLLFPRDVAAAPLEVTEDGEYHVWVCAAMDVESFIETGGRRFSFAPERARERQDTPIWRKLGTATLRRGEASVTCGPDILMLALSKAPGFDPERAMGDMRALPPGESVRDMRAETVRDTNTVFLMPRFESLAQWESASALLRQRILLGSGLYPMPEKTPLNARISAEEEYEDYVVSRVFFEAWPGFLATGNLYRPPGDGPWPGVVNPHGHWEHGRLEDSERASVAARCITLARMGAVAFSYDMIGYVDSRQTAHNWGGTRENLWGVHTFAAQLWTGIRAVDFLESLPYVDADRIGCTGASGGGTQTFALTAVDARIRVAAPVNMVSSTMQGGCLCENAPILRLNNSNMEIAALAAPRPLLLISATGDWTRETPRVEYPAIRHIYALYGATDKVENVHLDYGHNYNRPSREAMYRFFGRHLLGGAWDDFTEPACEKPDDDVLRVFPGDDAPEGYPAGEALIESLVDQSRQRREQRLADAYAAPDAFTQDYQGLFAALLGVSVPHPNDIHATRVAIEWRDDHVLERWILGRAASGDRIPALLYRGRDETPQDAVLMVHGRGKAFFADISGGPGPLVEAWLAQDKAVLLIDAFLTGEHHGPDRLREHQHVERFHDTFHPTDTGHRVQDVLTALAFLRARYDMTGIMDLVGVEGAGVWCILAGAADDAIRHIIADLDQADITDDALWETAWYVPGIRAVGDLPAAVMAAGPSRFTLFNTPASPELARTGATRIPEPLTPSAQLLLKR